MSLQFKKIQPADSMIISGDPKTLVAQLSEFYIKSDDYKFIISSSLSRNAKKKFYRGFRSRSPNGGGTFK